MGPTGAGKSSFIEALAGSNSSLEKISSGQLDSFTQDVQAYQVTGIINKLYVIDTPGFADTKISEFEIVSKVQNWMKANDLTTVSRILYLNPINCTRLPRSQKAVLNTFKALTRVDTAENIIVVTTMWDSIWNEQVLNRAESNFEQLRSEIWSEYIKNGARIIKFHNTQASAIHIIDQAISTYGSNDFQFENRALEQTISYHSPFGVNLYNDLITRMEGLTSRRNVLSSDFNTALGEGNHELQAILLSQLSDVDTLLQKFQQQLNELGAPVAPRLLSQGSAPNHEPAQQPASQSLSHSHDAHTSTPSSIAMPSSSSGPSKQKDKVIRGLTRFWDSSKRQMKRFPDRGQQQ
ncbi:hypothetical protein CVT24_012826 [Panaeolus cyanescens]|uniref:AIG1-type G domain-containing protein n=1 Tax=Panaeolus cyanescens TaxID=181874 RepID=A0A409YJL8_9AGAR|nr:hypothetical protein CVT24_012826 [Panaeolus cyanescens]